MIASPEHRLAKARGLTRHDLSTSGCGPSGKFSTDMSRGGRPDSAISTSPLLSDSIACRPPPC